MVTGKVPEEIREVLYGTNLIALKIKMEASGSLLQAIRDDESPQNSVDAIYYRNYKPIFNLYN